MQRGVLLFAIAVCIGSAADAQAQLVPNRPDYLSYQVKFGAKASHPAMRWEAFQFKDVTIDAEEKTLRLAQSVLVADEMGATDYHQGEALSDKIQAKKIFMLEGIDVLGAELLFYGSAKQVLVNGKELAVEKLVSTGWSRAKITTGFLKKGTNEIIFKGGGQLLVEPSKKPGHSFKSTDGGKTWSKEGLTGKANQEGEYLVRLRLGKYAASGWAQSQVFDLWQAGGQTPPAPLQMTSIRAVPNLLKSGEFTKIQMLLRLGSSGSPDEKNWTPWFPLDLSYYPEAKKYDVDLQGGTLRFGQLKIELSTSKGLISPRIPTSFGLEFEFRKDAKPDKITYEIAFKPDTHYELGPTPFVYQKPSPRLKLLREQYKLDQVIAPGKTELEQLMLLRYWVRNQWHTAWGSHPSLWMPQWDALMILANKDQPDCLTMCTHYAAVFTQCSQALGWNARHCILDHHCVSEVYMNDFAKWVMMDAGNSAQRADVGLHFETKGVPMSARELHLAQKSGKIDDIQVCFTPTKMVAKIAHLCRPAPKGKVDYPPLPDSVPAKELKNYPVCGLENYRRYAFPPRNNFLDTLLPGELYQGWAEYFYDGYCWVGDSPDNPKISPEYSIHLDPSRPHEADWQLNWTQIYLSRTGKPGQLRVDLGTFTPNFLHFERTVKAAESAAVLTKGADTGFTWDLQPGVNTLTVVVVNQWNKKGVPQQVTVNYKAP